jgi:HEPN domain-containing protein
MLHDPTLTAEAREWLKKAALDMRSAEHALSAFPPLLGDVVYHCQQAAEKSFKAFLVWHNAVFRKTHSLEEIGEQCLDLDPTLKDIVDEAVPLTEYAWKFRYPGEQEEPSEDEAKEALLVSFKVYEAVTARMPEEARP